nr:MAG TPA: hypothetical protein [Caudoviricetes sp.]
MNFMAFFDKFDSLHPLQTQSSAPIRRFLFALKPKG